MKIYLVRHAEALSPEINPERPLSPKGEADLEKLGMFLGKRGFPVSTILHSPKLRAKQTAEILRRHLEPHLELEECPHLSPDDRIEPILDRIEDGLMIVGHLPYLHKLCGMLINHDPGRTIVTFSPGKILCLERVEEHFAFDWGIGANHIP